MPDSDPLLAAVTLASSRPEVSRAVADLYSDLASQIALRKPVCLISGRCCRFEEFGHRLYVTTLELATFLHHLRAAGQMDHASHLVSQFGGAGCPFQIDRLCSVHLFRPFGCRIFFCDATARQWQEDTYEAFHRRLKSLHEQLEVPYFYVEWRQALNTLFQGHPDDTRRGLATGN